MKRMFVVNYRYKEGLADDDQFEIVLVTTIEGAFPVIQRVYG